MSYQFAFADTFSSAGAQKMSASEKAADAAVRSAVCDALLSTELIPVLPLIEIVIRYALPFRGVVSTMHVAWDRQHFMRLPYAVCTFGDDATFLVADVKASCL